MFVPKLTGTTRRRREAQQRLEQANAWLQRRLQSIDASAGGDLPLTPLSLAWWGLACTQQYQDFIFTPDLWYPIIACPASAGSAYAPHSRHRSHRDSSPSLPAHDGFRQGPPSKGGPHLSLDSQSGWSQGILAYGMQQKGKDQALRLKRDSPVPGLDLRGLQALGAREMPEALVWDLPQKAP